MILRRIAESFRRQDWTTVVVELVVVIVGLLLGLQLNDWSNNLRDQGLLESYYDQLILDLTADIATSESVFQTTDRYLKSGALIDRAARLGDVDGVSDEDLVLALITAGYTKRPLITRPTYDELISTGRLRLVDDITIKRALSNYYSSSESLRQWDALIQHEQMRYRDAIRGVLTPEQTLWVRESLDGPTRPPPDFDRAKFFQELMNRPEIKGSVASMAAEQGRLRYNSQAVTERASALIELLSN